MREKRRNLCIEFVDGAVCSYLCLSYRSYCDFSPNVHTQTFLMSVVFFALISWTYIVNQIAMFSSKYFGSKSACSLNFSAMFRTFVFSTRRSNLVLFRKSSRPLTSGWRLDTAPPGELLMKLVYSLRPWRHLTVSKWTNWGSLRNLKSYKML